MLLIRYALIWLFSLVYFYYFLWGGGRGKLCVCVQKQRKINNKKVIDIECFNCVLKGALSKACRCRTRCSLYKSNTHNDTICRCKDEQNGVKRTTDKRGNGSGRAAPNYVLWMEDTNIKQQQHSACIINENCLLVVTGATSHIVNDVTKLRALKTHSNQRPRLQLQNTSSTVWSFVLLTNFPCPGWLRIHINM